MGVKLRLIDHVGQCYVLHERLATPSADWETAVHDVLIPVPLAYETAGLDGFYLKLPYKFKGGEHSRVSGQILTIDGMQWKLVSWHYADGKPWRAGTDNLETHITHVKGFFLKRGATNAM
jgi:hypothetical protein